MSHTKQVSLIKKKQKLSYLSLMLPLKRLGLRSMPSRTLLAAGLAPASDKDVVNKSMTVPSW